MPCLQVHVDGLPMSPHWLRRSFSERMVDVGIERDVIGAILGHSTQSITTQHYAPVTWTEMVRAIRRLDYADEKAARR